MKNKIGVKIIFSLFLFGLLVVPALALGATPGATPAPSAANVLCEYTDDAGKIQCTSESSKDTCTYYLNGKVVASCPPAAAKPSAADNINVELKVPLPFVKTTDGKVQNLKDYIEGVYRLLIGAGALFAVVMIIIAGYQWMINGGSSGQIGDAKKRIWNASIGLVLALLSYVILNTISARLVELRLPTVDPVPPFYAGAGIYCADDLKIQALWQKSADKDNFLTEVGTGIGTKIDDAKCGHKYALADNAGQCQGSVCTDPKKSCVNNQCGSIVASGNITWSDASSTPYSGNGYVDYIRLYAVCGATLKMPTDYKLDVPEKGRAYNMINVFRPTVETRNVAGTNESKTETVSVEAPYYKIYKTDCESLGKKLRGYVLEVEVNDDLSGWNTIDDSFAVGKNCGAPLANKADGLIYKKDNFAGIDWSLVDDSALWQFEDLERGPINCNLSIDRAHYPAR